MDYQTLFNISLAVAAFLAGWVLNNITKTVEKLDRDVRAMPITYITKVDYHNDITEIKDMLVRIFDKLDKKADK